MNRKASFASLAEARTDLLHALDAHLADFAEETQARVLAGRAVAQADSETLIHLAGAIAASLIGWRDLVERLDIARAGDLDPARAGASLLESVFDEVLAPSASRILTAALALAQAAA